MGNSIIKQRLKESKAAVKSIVFLNQLGNYQPGFVWRKYGAERLAIRDYFPSLLSVGKDKALFAGSNELTHVLTTNLYDEQGFGTDQYGLLHSDLALDFYKELGVTERDLSFERNNLSDGVLAYTLAVSNLINTRCHYLTTAGAILYIEITISTELFLMKKAIDRNFILSEQSRRYLDSHIKHDANDHGPRIEKSLSKYSSPEDTQLILEGINIIMNAKHSFYNCLEKVLLKTVS